MTPAQFTRALKALGWSRRHLAHLLECDDKITNRWAFGRANIPPSVEKWLNDLVDCHRRLPPPNDWRVYERKD